MYRELINSFDLIMLVSIGELAGDWNLGVFSILQAEGFMYMLILPLAVFFYDRLAYKSSENSKNLFFILLCKLRD